MSDTAPVETGGAPGSIDDLINATLAAGDVPENTTILPLGDDLAAQAGSSAPVEPVAPEGTEEDVAKKSANVAKAAAEAAAPVLETMKSPEEGTVSTTSLNVSDQIWSNVQRAPKAVNGACIRTVGAIALILFQNSNVSVVVKPANVLPLIAYLETTTSLKGLPTISDVMRQRALKNIKISNGLAG